MIAFVWRYVVRPEHFADFERTYGPSGAWARLFAQAEGYQALDATCDAWTLHEEQIGDGNWTIVGDN